MRLPSARAPCARRAQPTRAFGGWHTLCRSRATIARAPSNRARRDDRRSSRLGRRCDQLRFTLARARRRRKGENEIVRRFSRVVRPWIFLERATDARGTRGFGRVLEAPRLLSGVRHKLEFASSAPAVPERARIRRGRTTRGRAVLRHRFRVGRRAGRSGSATELGTGGTDAEKEPICAERYLSRSVRFDDRARPGDPTS